MKLDKERESYLQYVLIEQHLTMNTKESYRLELEKYCNFLKKNNITDIKEVKIKLYRCIFDNTFEAVQEKKTGQNLKNRFCPQHLLY